ncbi:alpha/beta fold hydrolase [Kordiimonas sp. SCSIO 12610]|uniref:alpha/beta fold hydrolase n=1 Tax=Kordiimonas sp. SCSIO 12610 TaxID=2829597 RepID=UPI00210A5ADE|nr:alpha/beta hydrolase [Kordiimonas sp. SCSIO 12610]UTW56014.1 alpha/beta hydrolase [Kordiimonas sp. SCSIO 12610]
MLGELENLLKAAKESRRQEPEGATFDFVKNSDGGLNRYGLFPLPSSQINFTSKANHSAENSEEKRVENADGVAPRGTVIFIPGRTEFIEKFYEDIHMFHALGFSCAAFDLRGQGLSHRENPDRDKHYVETFDNHLSDLRQLFEEILKGENAVNLPEPYILMGHSAGSHVILRFLSEHQGYAAKAITVAPMVRVASGGAPNFILYGLPKLMISLGRGSGYIPGHTKFKTGRWGWRKKLTHDDARFEDEDYFIHNKDADLAVGGATFKWLHEALNSIDKLNAPTVPEAIDVPVLMLQAGEDQIVDNAAQTALAKRVPEIGLVRIEGAMHELLKETDDKRLLVWQSILPFLGLELSKNPDP